MSDHNPKAFPWQTGRLGLDGQHQGKGDPAFFRLRERQASVMRVDNFTGEAEAESNPFNLTATGTVSPVKPGKE
jgi:hypothetical protein